MAATSRLRMKLHCAAAWPLRSAADGSDRAGQPERLGGTEVAIPAVGAEVGAGAAPRRRPAGRSSARMASVSGAGWSGREAMPACVAER